MITIDVKKIADYLDKKQYDTCLYVLEGMHPADIASLINHLSDEHQIQLFNRLNENLASDILAELYDDVRENIILNTQNERLFRIIDEMETDDATDVLEDLEETIQEEILEHIDEEDSENIRSLLQYDEDTAGGLMQAEIIAVRKEMKRDALITDIRYHFEDVERIHYVFVVDEKNCLIGVLNIVNLLLATKHQTAEDLMKHDVISVHVNEDQEEVAHIFRKYDIYALPVIDDNRVLLGRITVDDIIDVIDEEAQEDAFKMVGLGNEDRIFTAPFNSVKKRIPWLTLNLGTAMLVSMVVGFFEQTIANMTVLAVLMPIVAGLGGNSGTQTLTVITRGIAMGELTIHNTWKAIFKEISVAIMNGIIVGAIAMLVAFFLKGNILLGVVLGGALITNMFIAGLFGSLVPILLKSMNIDPALASSIIITMLTDMCGFASFLGLATLILT